MRPYYNDPYTTEFSAEVTKSFKRGDNFAVSLDTSYFYPTSGGQEHDKGFISDAEVIDVFEEDGVVFHLLSNEVPVGRVECLIDRARRFGNMQQHTGQHILSAAFENLFDIATVSSRLGEYIGTIDLSRQPTAREVEEAVNTANKIVQENRPVALHYVEPENIGAYKLRKLPKVDGVARIVEVKDFDMSPCGGTHCTHTSEIGVVITGRVEKVKSSLTRIEFFCGNRAVSRFNELHESAQETSRLLSSSFDDIPQAVTKLKNQLQESEARAKILNERVLENLCERLVPRVEGDPSGMSVINLSSEVRSTDELRFVSSCVSKKMKRSFAFHRLEGNICYMNVNLAIDEKAGSAILNELRPRFGAKGGGRNGFYSLTFDSEHLDKLTDFVKESIEHG